MCGLDNLDIDLQELRKASVGNWLENQSVDLDAFDALAAYVLERLEQLKQGDTVSKQLVKTLLEASNVLLAAGNDLQSNRFMGLVGKIVSNDEVSEQKSGFPRLI